MSIFRPHKTKPRQFNYTPRFYDPVKEAFDQRRRELHGTSSETDDLPYSPGDYLRMKSEARRESRAEQSKSASNRLLRYGILIVVVGMGFAYIMPHATEILTRFMNAGQNTEVVDGEMTMGADSTMVAPTMILNEQHEDIDFTEFESLTPEALNEIEVYNMLHPNINIYPDDVEIVDGKRVESKE
ncbi:MAG: hypothetical protein II322_02785 [Alistipes sp.]|nr:hypothetical protein [Alistipes sp.]